MKINRKTLYIAALGYLWMGGTETILAQDATADSVKTGFFNAMDYVRQKRYIPAGRVIDPKARGWNSSLLIFAGAGKLGGGAAGPYSKEFGIAFTKDVTSFNSYRLAVEGAVNEQIGRGGVEIAHMFRILDYLRGYKDDLRWDLETVLGIGIYGTKNKVSKERFVAGGIHGGLHVNYHLHNHLDLFLEPRVNLFTDGINGLESQKRYDIGAQAMAGLTYRFTGLNKTSGPSANSGALDNLFYEIYAGIQGDYSARIRKAPIMNGVLEPVGPVMGISMGKWFLPFGIRGTLFAGVHNTLSEKGTEKIKEGYGGVRLEAMVNLNRLFDDRVTDPRLEVNLMGGAEAGFVAHRGATYARKVRPFTGPTLGGQLVYAVNDHIGVFGQARWSKNSYTQNFLHGTSSKRRMQNLSIEMGVQYRRREECITRHQYLFEPYNFVSVGMGANYPMRTGDQQLKAMMKHLGQQFYVGYGRRWSKYSSVRGYIEMAHYPYSVSKHVYPFTLGADYLVDLSTLAATYNPERIFTVEGLAGILYTHHGTAQKDYFGVQAGLKETVRINDQWGVFAEEVLRGYKGAITPGARTLTEKGISLLPYANLGVNLYF